MGETDEDGGGPPHCPNCRRANIRKRINEDTEWKCYDCEEKFDDPIYKDTGDWTSSGVAKKLVEMDADDLSADGRTDDG